MDVVVYLKSKYKSWTQTGAPPLLRFVFRSFKFTPRYNEEFTSESSRQYFLTFSRINFLQAFISISLEQKRGKLTFIQWIQKKNWWHDASFPDYPIGPHSNKQKKIFFKQVIKSSLKMKDDYISQLHPLELGTEDKQEQISAGAFYQRAQYFSSYCEITKLH